MNLRHRRLPAVLLAALFSVVLVAAAPPARAASQGAGGSAPPDPAAVAVPPAAPRSAAADEGLQERAKSFYAFLRGRQVNIFSLYQNETFRGYFSAEEALDNYISYLTSRLGERKFRKHRIERTEVESVKQRGPDRATVRVKLVGRHKDLLLFWDQTVIVEDDWRRVEGEWYTFPPPF